MNVLSFTIIHVTRFRECIYIYKYNLGYIIYWLIPSQLFCINIHLTPTNWKEIFVLYLPFDNTSMIMILPFLFFCFFAARKYSFHTQFQLTNCISCRFVIICMFSLSLMLSCSSPHHYTTYFYFLTSHVYCALKFSFHHLTLSIVLSKKGFYLCQTYKHI